MFQWKSSISVVAIMAGLSAPNIGSSGELIYQSVGFIDGSDARKTSFNVTSAGWYSMRLVDFEHGEAFQQLSFAVGDGETTYGSLFGKGETKIKIDAPGQYYAYVMGQAGNVYDLGMYGASIQLSEQAPIEPTPSAVPLPASFWLLGSAMAAWLGLFSRRRRRGT